MKQLKYAVMAATLALLAACGQMTPPDAELNLLDNTIADGDEAVPVAANTLNFGNVCEGATVSKTPLIAIERDRAGSSEITFRNDTTVTVTVTGVTGAGVTAGMGSANTITLPTNWNGQSTGAMSNAVSSTVTLVAGSTAGGPFSGTITYQARGLNRDGNTVNRNTTLPVSWTVVSCAAPNTAPTKPGAPTLSSGSNPNNSGEFTLSWTASTDAEDNPITYLLQHQNAGGGWDTVASGLTTNSYAFISTYPEGEGAWKYRVQASDGLLSSAFSDDSVSIVVDKTAPVVSGADVTNTTWRNSPLSEDFTASDAGSGLANTADASFTLTAEDESADADTPTIVSKTVYDNAGNSTTRSVSALIDLNQPTNIQFNGISDDASYYKDFVPATVTCSADDALSGVESCNVSGHSDQPGVHTLTATATDKAGNEAMRQISYTVRDWEISGFHRPVEMNKLNIIRNGSSVPNKFNVFVDGVEVTSTSMVAMRVVQVNCNAVEVTEGDNLVTETSTGGTSLRYSDNQFIYNWQSPKRAGNCYRIQMTYDSGPSIRVVYQLR